MNREDWDKLDELLGKEGFGGYYDLVECLKDTGRDLISDLPMDDESKELLRTKVDSLNTIHKSVNFLQFLMIRMRKRDDRRID